MLKPFNIEDDEASKLRCGSLAPVREISDIETIQVVPVDNADLEREAE